MARRRWLLAVFLWTMTAVAPARADTVRTTSGQEFVGTVVEETPKHVVIDTDTGRVTVPRHAVESLVKDGDAGDKDPDRRRIKAVTVDPHDVEEALKKAYEAFKAEKWYEAGGLLEGLMALDSTLFPMKKRKAATGALVTCHLQVGDISGAVRNFRRRAHVLPSRSDRKRMLAAAEALRLCGKKINGKTVKTYTEALGEALPWTAKRVFAKAKAKAMDVPEDRDLPALEVHRKKVLETLAEADVYVPGYVTDERKTALVGEMAGRIVAEAGNAVTYCTRMRRKLSTQRYAAVTVRLALQYNAAVKHYHGLRRAAMESLDALPSLMQSYGGEKLYDASRVRELKQVLEDLRYHVDKSGTTLSEVIKPKTFGAH